MTPSGVSDGQGGADLLHRIAVYVPASVIPAVVTLLTSVIFTRIFDAEQFGLFGLALVVANMAKTAFTVWLGTSIGKYLPPALEADDRVRVKRAIFLSSVLMLGVEAVVGVGAIIAAHYLLDGDARTFATPVVLYVVVSSLFDVLSAVFPAEHRAREYVTYQLVVSVATLAVRLVMVSAVIGMGITLMFWSVVVTYLLVLPVMWVRAGMLAPVYLKGVAFSGEDRKLVGDFFAFGLPMTLWLVATLLLDVADRFVIEYFDGTGDVGIYDANYRLIVGAVALMIVPVTITLHPYLMRISGYGVPEHIGTVIGIIVENLVLLGALSVGVVLLFHNEIALLLGPDFRSGSIIMPIVLGGVFVFNIGTFVHKPFEIVGRTAPMVVVAYIAAAANVGFNLILVPVMGYLGAAWATLIAYVLYTVTIGVRGRRIYDWRISRGLYGPLAMVVTAIGAIGMTRVLLSGTGEVLDLLVSGAASGLLTVWVLLRVRAGVTSVPRLPANP